jgi:hypothetical protein
MGNFLSINLILSHALATFIIILFRREYAIPVLQDFNGWVVFLNKSFRSSQEFIIPVGTESDQSLALPFSENPNYLSLII